MFIFGRGPNGITQAKRGVGLVGATGKALWVRLMLPHL